jgi:stage IV sporulation protein FB
MEDTLVTEVVYPAKPEWNEKKQAIGKSLLSLALYIITFYFFFDWELQMVFMLTLALIIHEMGHFIAMKAFGYKDVNMFFVPLLGAFVSGRKHIISQKQDVIMLLAGPVPGILIGLGIAIAAYVTKTDLFRIANIFIYLNLFNLLPIIPLDGGKVLKALFFNTNEIINTVFICISVALLVLLCIVLKSFYLLIIPYFLILQLVSQSQTKKARAEISDRGIELAKNFDELTDREYWLIRDSIGTHINYYKKLVQPGIYVPSEKEDKIAGGVVSVLQTPPLKDLGAGGKVLVIFIILACFIVPFISFLLSRLYSYYLINQMFQF